MREKQPKGMTRPATLGLKPLKKIGAEYPGKPGFRRLGGFTGGEKAAWSRGGNCGSPTYLPPLGSRASPVLRVQAVALCTRYSELCKLSVDDLKDQLRGWKLKLGKASNFTVTQRDRKSYALQIQALMAAEHGKSANDLLPGDAGTDGRGVLRKRAEFGRAGKKRSGKRGKDVVEYDGWEWGAEEEFEIDAIVDKQVADGQRAFANLGKVRKGVIVYRLVFAGFPPDMEWWEPRSEVGTEALEDYEAALAMEAAEAEADEAEEAELEQMEGELGEEEAESEDEEK